MKLLFSQLLVFDQVVAKIYHLRMDAVFKPLLKCLHVPYRWPCFRYTIPAVQMFFKDLRYFLAEKREYLMFIDVLRNQVYLWLAL